MVGSGTYGGGPAQASAWHSWQTRPDVLLTTPHALTALLPQSAAVFLGPSRWHRQMHAVSPAFRRWLGEGHAQLHGGRSLAATA